MIAKSYLITKRQWLYLVLMRRECDDFDFGQIPFEDCGIDRWRHVTVNLKLSASLRGW